MAFPDELGGRGHCSGFVSFFWMQAAVVEGPLEHQGMMLMMEDKIITRQTRTKEKMLENEESSE